MGFTVPRVGRWFLVVTLLQCLATLAFNILILAKSVDSTEEYYAILVILTVAFTVFFALEAIYQENVYELIACLVCNAVLLLRIVNNYVEVNRAGRHFPESLAALILSSIFTLLTFILAYFAWKSFGYKVYKTLQTADMTIIDMYNRYLQFKSIAGVDVQFGCTLLLMAIYYCRFDSEEIVVGCSCANLFIWLFAVVAIRKETNWCVWLFTAFALPAPAYFIFKIYRMFSDPSSSFYNIDDTLMKRIRAVLTITCVLAIIVRGLLLACVFRCRQNFGHGLPALAFQSLKIRFSFLRNPRGSIQGREREDALAVMS